MPKKKTHDEYVAELAIKNPNLEVLEEYVNAHTKIIHRCIIHNIEQKVEPNNALAGKGCPECGREKYKKKRRKSHEVYVDELSKKNPNVEVIEEYINANTPISHRCLLHDIVWDITPSRALQGNGCPICHTEKIKEAKTRTHEEYLQLLKDLNPNIIPLEQYIDCKTHILHKCLKHNIEWRTMPENILHGCGCPECGKDKVSEKNSKTHDQYIKDLVAANPNIIVLEEYVNINTPILHKCLIDGYEWYVSPINILFRTGCPKCHRSRGEKKVENWLVQNHIDYEAQKIFKDCKDIKPLPFDFYLPSYNTCIEYDGEQHYREVDFFGNSLAYIQNHDYIKNKYCKDNNIQLIRIPYTEFDNIENTLHNYLYA